MTVYSDIAGPRAGPSVATPIQAMKANVSSDGPYYTRSGNAPYLIPCQSTHNVLHRRTTSRQCRRTGETLPKPTTKEKWPGINQSSSKREYDKANTGGDLWNVATNQKVFPKVERRPLLQHHLMKRLVMFPGLEAFLTYIQRHM